ncbi:E3 ubiquitin-protein ligase UHRF1-like isoform X2 [Leptidea sinapis]|uniref:E3 ubiquitin-protein ligase UHRF1-like isoform X2 n=1 Tax=Leptidea sinapis TaxID=189913 RepID=UPI00213FD75C|nr:E3 ubiquitin-protein ligase UHRF1-like isoform X2 [Leptidea sinapis]
MHVRIRVPGKPDTTVPVVSKLTKIEQFRRLVKEKLNVDPRLQCLLYGGKLLEDGYTFHDYNIKLNDVIQLMIRPGNDKEDQKAAVIDKSKVIACNTDQEETIPYEDAKSSLYLVGDLVDIRDSEDGAWVEGKIVRIVLDPKIKSEEESQPDHKEGNLLFKVQCDDDEEDSDLYCKVKEIRPRACKEIDVMDLKTGQVVMINHNPNEPNEKGHWYDFKIDEVQKNRNKYKLVGTIYLGKDAIPQDDTTAPIHDKIFAIEEAVPVNERTDEYKTLTKEPPPKRSQALKCRKCRDDKEVSCKECGCFLCAGKESPNEILLCDECDRGYHMSCLSPAVTEVPAGDWYCPSCRRDPNEVVAPGAAKQRKKQTSKSGRDWGRGMACVGKTKTCAMPANHFGPIPGVEVGMCWRYRIQVSESGVHRPPVSGIHGRDVHGAYSIVLSGGYEDDYDAGFEFTYCGSGGRDLSGNRRTAAHSTHQTLTRENRALARNCAVEPVCEDGGDAGEDWRNGRPVRVVRAYKMMRHFPEFAPSEGFRYDGIYKVVKYYPEVGLSGFRVWKYLLRRDDPSPAPWEPGAKQYAIVYPDGFLEAEAQKKALKLKTAGDKKKKRPLKPSTSSSPEASPEPLTKKRKVDEETQAKSPGVKIPAMFLKSPKLKKAENINSLSPAERDAIKADTLNYKLWEECVEVYEKKGRKEFVEHVTQQFLCIICQEVAAGPVTTACLHNFCLTCLKLAFKSNESQQCPSCRHGLADMTLAKNDHLTHALRTVLPGYDVGKK